MEESNRYSNKFKNKERVEKDKTCNKMKPYKKTTKDKIKLDDYV